ncbi:1,4-dihydroxy-2-naphthoyl-CoA hydrolase [Streptomyces alboniger]
MSDTLPQNDLRAQLLAAVPFAEHLGITFAEAGPGRVEGTLPWSAELCTAGGVLHGGAVMSLTDTVGAVCAFLNLPDGAITSTIESKTNFLRAVRSGAARAVARPLHSRRLLHRRADGGVRRRGAPRRADHADAGGALAARSK